MHFVPESACSVSLEYLSQCWPAGLALTPFYVENSWVSRDDFVHAPGQWETTLHCTVVSHWLGAHTKWSLGQSWSVVYCWGIAETDKQASGHWNRIRVNGFISSNIFIRVNSLLLLYVLLSTNVRMTWFCRICALLIMKNAPEGAYTVDVQLIDPICKRSSWLITQSN